MAGVLDSNAFRVLGYVFAAVICVLTGWRERVHVRSERHDLWPTFWYLSAVLLLVLAVGRVGLGDLLSDFGRHTAREEGWYQTRRKLQAVVVGSFAAAWGIAVLVAIWRVPERRRRYLPAAIVISGLVCFAAIRLVSLHQVDTLLYRRDIGGVHIVAIVETIGIALVLLSTLWNPFVRARSEENAPRSPWVSTL
jgi:uncharacterized membrane protein